MNKINQEAADNFNKKQQIFLKELQNCHRNNVKLEQKDKDFFRKNNKGVVNVHTYNLSPSKIKSLKRYQKGREKVLILYDSKQDVSNLSRCYANNMYTQTNAQSATFGGENAVPAPQKINFLREPNDASLKIAKNNLPTDFKPPSSKYHKVSAHQSCKTTPRFG